MLNALNMNHSMSSDTRRPDAYDTRIGNGNLPAGFQGTANRAYTREVQGNELMGQRLGALLDSNSSYMRSARNRGLEQAGSRGMLNSSMAAGNAQRAAIDAGAPIAAQEAGAYMQAASENQRWLNERQNAIDQIEAAQISSRSASFNAAAAAQAEVQMQRERLAFEGEQRGLDREHALYEADVELNNRLAYGEAEFGWTLGRDAFQFGNEDYRAGRDFGFQTERDFRQFGFEDYAANRDFGFREQEDLRGFANEDYRAGRDFGFRDFEANRDFNFERAFRERDYSNEDYRAFRDRSFQRTRDREQFEYTSDLNRREYEAISERQREQADLALRDYAARTGMDLRAHGAQYLDTLFAATLEDPATFPPDVVAAMASSFLPVMEDFSTDFFANFNLGTNFGNVGRARPNNSGRRSRRRGG